MTYRRVRPWKARSEVEFLLFMGDLRLCLRGRGITSHKTASWYGDALHEFFYKCEWAYSPYDGTRNAVYFPSLDRWHTLTEFWRRDDEQCQFRFNATESTEPEPVPEEFVPMSPMAIVERMRLPEPVRVEISWSLWHDKKTSSLHCSLAFPPVRCTTMEELGKDRSALDQFLAEC